MDQSISEHHHLIDIIANILLFFAISGLIIPLLQRIKISPVLGYLLCGITIGPFGIAKLSPMYNWISYVSISEPDTVTIIGELGIIALMFMIGLNLSLDRLKELSKFIFGLGSVQVLITSVIIFIIANFFGNTLQASVLIGASFALSSTAIVMKLLEEQKLSNRPIGILCFSILLMQDLAVVPILVLASSFSSNQDANVILALSTSLLFGVVTVAAIYLIGRKILTYLLQLVSFATTPEWLAAFISLIVLACSILTYKAGLSLALGAFMVGLLIAETEFKHEVEVIISPIKGLLLGLFFLSIGMMIDLTEVMRHSTLLSVSVIGIYLVKSLIIFVLCLAFRIPVRQSAEASIYLAQPGEFALMILGVAVSTKLMPEYDVQFFLLVTVIAMMMTPIFFKIAPMFGELCHRILGKEEEGNKACVLNITNKVVIAGFGRVGQIIAKTLNDQKIQYIAFDNKKEYVEELRGQNFDVIHGDACEVKLWENLIEKDIDMAIIAIDDHESTIPILSSLREKFPLLTVIVRSKDEKNSAALYDEGANEVVAETQESSFRIAQLVMERFGINPKEIRTIIKKMRNQNHQTI